MKRVLFFIALSFAVKSKAVAQMTSPEAVAEKIANKMKDTLSLTNEQRNQVYNLNILINNNKANIRQQYTNRDSIGYYLQRIESSRDSMYHTVLPEEKYLLYKQKKRTLVSAN